MYKLYKILIWVHTRSSLEMLYFILSASILHLSRFFYMINCLSISNILNNKYRRIRSVYITIYRIAFPNKCMID